jgi:hypothetical protein
MLREVALELALDFARYGGNTFPCVDLGRRFPRQADTVASFLWQKETTTDEELRPRLDYAWQR